MSAFIDNALTVAAVALGLVAFIAGLAVFATEGGVTGILIFDIGLIYVVLGLLNSWLTRRWRGNLGSPTRKRAQLFAAKAVVVIALAPAALIAFVVALVLLFSSSFGPTP